MSTKPPSSLTNCLIGGAYRLGKHLGSGTFADVFLAVHCLNGKEVAVKISKPQLTSKALRNEKTMYDILDGAVGIPKIRYFGSEKQYFVLVMDVLGPSLSTQLIQCSGQFTLKSVLILGDQIINLLQFIHSKSIIHRDLTPNNILMGAAPNSTRVHIIDFGKANFFRDPKSGKHIIFGTDEITTDSAFGSVQNDAGLTQSRRDDMQSLGYILLYLLGAKLPWLVQNAGCSKQHLERMKEKKLSTSTTVLCHGFPNEFSMYLNHCRNLKFEEEPKYDFLKCLFRNLYQSRDYQDDQQFDWSPKLVSGEKSQ